VAVCVKQVMSPDVPVRPAETRTWAREDGSWALNEPDAYALEEALRLREARGAEVVAISAGPARVAQVLRECLARGADRAIHVNVDLPPVDPAATSSALAEALGNDPVDLVLTGLQSSDAGSAAVGGMLAERLGMAHATIAVKLEVGDSTIDVTRELEAGWFQTVTLPLPAVVTVQSGINQLRYVTLKGIQAAKKKETLVVGVSSPATPGQRVLQVYAPPRKATGQMISGPPADAARELVRILRDKRLV
jgi:electron transfer flavoprotein beta subunit